ncbi:CsbD family protein [Persicobacter psychrovividus]|uniref:CsbD-like domain-containing protein n=1 Tax=Persicobacter psychrovividus TaxID=387638 RepID=A0ABM7VII6_9BACT|nr:hypothetical protein PEPS_30670 [Persicobacter psychrovividus]
MNDLQFKGNWNDAKGKLKQQYGEFVDDDSMYAEGSLDRLIGALQEKTGKTKEAIKEEMNKLFSS